MQWNESSYMRLQGEEYTLISQMDSIGAASCSNKNTHHHSLYLCSQHFFFLEVMTNTLRNIVNTWIWGIVISCQICWVEKCKEMKLRWSQGTCQGHDERPSERWGQYHSPFCHYILLAATGTKTLCPQGHMCTEPEYI